MKTLTFSLLPVLAALALSGCSHMGSGPMAKPEGHGAMMGGRMAVATLTPTQGQAVRGLVMFHEMDGHLMVHAQLSGVRGS